MNAVEVDSLSKIFRLSSSPMQRFYDFMGLKNKRQPSREFYALRDVSFKVTTGTSVGIIGSNGSGKSTLLKIICGIMEPTKGTVITNGKVSALLELGAGFNPEFSGRENIYMNGLLLGFSRAEMERRFPEIEAFAEIGEFIDQPVKTYSHGMFVRLAFATAIHVDPDILVVDEALAVGDMFFQQRCLSKLEAFRDQGKTIILVTHDINLVKRFCNSAVLLDNGKVFAEGDPEFVTEQYLMLVRQKQTQHATEKFRVMSKKHSSLQNAKVSFGSKAGQILEVSALNKDLQETAVFLAGDPIIFRIRIQVDPDVKTPGVGLMIRDQRGYDIYGTSTHQLGVNVLLDSDRQATMFFSVSAILAAGDYSLAVGIVDHGPLNAQMGIVLDKQVGVGVFKVVWNNYKFSGTVDLHATVYQNVLDIKN